MVAWLAFFVPEAMAVLALSRRYPGEGGVYLWCREHFGEMHGFLAGWCYWTNSLFYVPVLLVYLAGVAAYAGGDRWGGLVDDKWFVGGVAFGWLAFITAANIRGLAVGKWINNIGGAGGLATVALAAAAAAVARTQGTAVEAPPVAGTPADMAGALGAMLFAFIGIELASTMAEDPPSGGHPAVGRRASSRCRYLVVADAAGDHPPGNWGPSG